MLATIRRYVEPSRQFRAKLACHLEHKLLHTDHVAHIVYLGSVTFAAHEFAHYAEAASFVLVTVHFALSGWGE